MAGPSSKYMLGMPDGTGVVLPPLVGLALRAESKLRKTPLQVRMAPLMQHGKPGA